MKLHLGIMNNSELAEWFEITYPAFASSKKKKLEILKRYAEFEETKGKINITKIYQEEYLGDAFSKLRPVPSETLTDETETGSIDRIMYVKTLIMLNKITTKEAWGVLCELQENKTKIIWERID